MNVDNRRRNSTRWEAALVPMGAMVLMAAALAGVASAAGGAAGTIVDFAGASIVTPGDGGGPARGATLFLPSAVAVDAAGNVYIAGPLNRVRKVNTSGTITNFAGSAAGPGTQGNTSDGGPATSALLDNPAGLGVDSAGNVYIADQGNDRVREVVASTVDEAPLIASAANATFTLGVGNSFDVAAYGFPALTVTETGSLPAGVTFNAATLALSGTPAAGTIGRYPITFGATNGIGADASQSFTLVVAALPGYTALVPVRICDTRAAGPGVGANQCDTHGHSPLGTSGVLSFTAAGAAGVPADATAVVLHVTATGTNAASS